jgi:glycosyltransferase involved in cell wall biosynthesis
MTDSGSANVDIINLSEMGANWCWLKDEFQKSHLNWQHFTSQSIHLPIYLPKKTTLVRGISAWQAVQQAQKSNSLIVSHGPRPAMYAGGFAKILKPSLPHLVYSFNFTQLPTGMQHKAMVKAYQQPQRFVSFSTLETQLYADYFDIPIEKIDMLHWSVHAPIIQVKKTPLIEGEYICAIGSQGRDYATLFAAIQKLPEIKLVAVCNQDSIRDLLIPSNVEIRTNIPLADANHILANSMFMVLPLRDSQVPCGHVTLVSCMFLKKAMVVTNSAGVHDYIKADDTGVFCEPKNPDDLAKKIQMLWDDQDKRKRIALNGLGFAQTHCSEKTVINYFSDYLNNLKTL